MKKEIESLDFAEQFAIMAIADGISDEMGESGIMQAIADTDDEKEIERLAVESEKIAYKAINEVVKTEAQMRKDLYENADDYELTEPVDVVLEKAIEGRKRVVTHFLNMHYQVIGSKLSIGENLTYEEVEARNSEA